MKGIGYAKSQTKHPFHPFGMNPRKPNFPKNVLSLKLIILTTLLIFIFFTCFTIIKNKTHNPNLKTYNYFNTHSSDQCINRNNNNNNFIHNLEPLISKEPLNTWEGLGNEEKNIKYLSSVTDLSTRNRLIYIDLGAREYDSSIGSWFLKKYPKQNKKFEIYAVEADKNFHNQYKSRGGVTLIPYAAWIKNETVVFGSKPIVVKDKVWRMRPFGRIEGEKEEENKLSAVSKVQAFDFVDWLKRTVRSNDFVVVKMDVEGTEISLIKELVERGAICLIDELFMECHFDRYVKCCEGERINRFNYSYEQCYQLFSELRKNGSVVHQWW